MAIDARAAWRLLSVLILAAGLGASASADMLADFRTETQALRKDVIALDESWYRLLGWLPESDGNIEAVDLVLKRAVDSKDIHVRAYRIGGKLVRARAWVPGWNDIEHHVGFGELKVSGSRKTGSVSGTVYVHLAFDGWVPLEGKPLNSWWSVNGKFAGGQLKGSFRGIVPQDEDAKEPRKAELPLTRGTLLGSLTVVNGPVQRPKELPPPKIKGWNGYLVYAYARRFLKESEDRYQQIRAIDIAVRHNLSYANALRQVQTPVSYYEDFDPPKLARQKKIGKGAGVPSLDDEEDDGLGLGDETVADTSPAAELKKDKKAPKALACLKQMRKRIQTLQRLAITREKAGRDYKLSYLTDTTDPGDPMFHPWYSTAKPLGSVGKNGAHKLGAEAGTGNKQNWAPVCNWKRLGPFPVGEWYHWMQHHERGDRGEGIKWTTLTPGLPAVVTEAVEKIKADRFPGGKWGSSLYKGPRVLTWQKWTPYDDFGGMAPPFQANRNPTYGQARIPPGGRTFAGMDYGAYLADAEIHSEKDVELWAALGMQARGMLWVNGKLHWVGPTTWRRHWLTHNGRSPADHKAEYVAMFKIPFKKGRNHIRVRNEIGFASQHLWLRLCTRGKPKDPAAAKAFEQKVAEARKKLAPPTQGFWLRGNGTGVFKDAQPPVAFNIKRGKNIKWYTALPYWSNASPVLTKAPSTGSGQGYVFAMTEPDRLLCLSRADGEILWERKCSAIDTLPEAERKKGHALYERWWAALQKRIRIPSHVIGYDKWRGRSHMYYWHEGKTKVAKKDERKDASPELIALLDKRDELEASDDPESVQDQLTKVLQQIEKLKEKASEGDPAVVAATKARADLGKAYGELIKFLGSHFGVSKLGGYWVDYDGYQFSTPVTDGKHVWAKSGFGGLACFDMQGNRKWLVAHGGTGSGSSTIPSPKLVDGKIIVKLKRKSKTNRRGQWMMAAFDAKTGKELWATPCTATGWGASTGDAIRLTNGQESMVVLVTDHAQVIRADDGKMLVGAMQAKNDCTGLAREDDIVAFTATPPMAAFRIVMLDRETIGYRPFFRRGDSAQYASAIVADGLVYTFQGRGGSGVSSGPGEKWGGMRRFRIKDGLELETTPIYRKGGNNWSVPSASRDYLYMYGGDNIFCGAGNKQPMTMSVIERGTDGDLVAVNAVERSYSGAVMEGEELYMHGYHGVWCVAYTGEEGRAYEARHVVETLLDQMPWRRPKGSEIKETKSLPREIGGKSQRNRLNWGLAPGGWFLAGPYAPGAASAIVKECRDSKHWTETDASGTGWKLLPMNWKGGVRAVNAPGWVCDGETFTLIDRQRQRVVDLLRVVKREPGKVYYLFAKLENPGDRTARFHLGTPGLKAWVNGVQLADGDRCKLPKGHVTVLIEVTIGPDASKDVLEISPRFYDSRDLDAEEAAWVKFMTRHRKRLQAAVDRAPDSLEARRAAAVLAQL